MESSLYPGAIKPRFPDVPVKPVPNVLGQGPTIKAKSRTPTKSELLQLAMTVRALPAMHPGTLEQVVDAWSRMPPDERAVQPLAIANQNLTYGTAFTFLGKPAVDLDSFNARDRIIFGAATVVEREHCFLIESRKKFQHESDRLPLLLVSTKRNLVPAYLSELVNKKATLFWHGVTPELAGKGNSFRFEVDSRSVYTGIALRAGEFVP